MLSKKKPQDKVDPEYLVGLDTASAQPAPAGVKPFIKKHWKPITAAICAAVVAAAVLVPKNSAKPAAASSQYVETRPEKRNIVNSYSADGTITAADAYTVKPMVKGTVLTADFEVGDTVNKGDVRHPLRQQYQKRHYTCSAAQPFPGTASTRGSRATQKMNPGAALSDTHFLPKSSVAAFHWFAVECPYGLWMAHRSEGQRMDHHVQIPWQLQKPC